MFCGEIAFVLRVLVWVLFRFSWFVPLNFKLCVGVCEVVNCCLSLCVPAINWWPVLGVILSLPRQLEEAAADLCDLELRNKSSLEMDGWWLWWVMTSELSGDLRWERRIFLGCLGLNRKNGTPKKSWNLEFFFHSSYLKVNKMCPSDKWPAFNRFAWQPGAICLLLCSLFLPGVSFCCP